LPREPLSRWYLRIAKHFGAPTAAESDLQRIGGFVVESNPRHPRRKDAFDADQHRVAHVIDVDARGQLQSGLGNRVLHIVRRRRCREFFPMIPKDGRTQGSPAVQVRRTSSKMEQCEYHPALFGCHESFAPIVCAMERVNSPGSIGFARCL